MRFLLGNVMLALAWLGVTGDFSLANFGVGLLVGALVIYVVGEVIGARGYGRRIVAALRLAGTLVWELLAASGRVAFDVITPTMHAHPAIVAVTLKARSDVELLLLSMLVSLTPGTVVVDIPKSRERMYVYGMYVDDAEQFADRIQRVFEKRVLDVTREAR